MYDTNDSFANWMIAGGARLDPPEPRRLAQLVALRDARRTENHTAPLGWLAERLGLARQEQPQPDPMTICCTA